MKKFKFVFSFIAFNLAFSGAVVSQELFGLERSNLHEVISMEISKTEEPDIKRALGKGLLNAKSTAYSIVNFTDLTGAKWSLHVLQNMKSPEGPTFFVPHDNENDAFESGALAITTYGGHLLALECGENRACDRNIDPNRHFMLENTLYVSTIMRFFDAKSFPVITLHNNHNSHYRLGGEGAIYADLEEPYTDGTGFYYAGDADDLIIYADNHHMDDSPIFQFYQTEFERLNLNSIYEFIRPEGELAGHMSTYVLRHAGREYFNIEAEHGHFSAQNHYLNLLMDILGVVSF